MSLVKALFGWLLEPATEQSIAARESRSLARARLAETARERVAKREMKAEERAFKEKIARERREERQREKQATQALRVRERQERVSQRAQERAEARRERLELVRERAQAAADRLAQRLRSRAPSKSNPKSGAHTGGLNIGDKRCLSAAQRMSMLFHGTPDQVVELDKRERNLPRFAVVIGRQRKIAYEAPPESKRAGVVWEHESGDLGASKAPSRRSPMLLADPETGTVFTVKDKSPMRFSSKRGIVG